MKFPCLIEKFFTSPLDSAFLHAFSTELFTTKCNRANFVKEVLKQRPNLLSLITSQTSFDLQNLLVTIFFKSLPSKTILRNQLFYPFTTDFCRITVDNFKYQSKDFIIAINKSGSILGFRCFEVVFNSSRENFMAGHCFFNASDIKIYAENIYYVNYKSIEMCILRESEIELILSEKKFILQVKIFDEIMKERLINIFTLNSIKYEINLLLAKLSGLRTPDNTKLKDNLNISPNKQINTDVGDKQVCKTRLKTGIKPAKSKPRIKNKHKPSFNVKKAEAGVDIKIEEDQIVKTENLIVNNQKLEQNFILSQEKQFSYEERTHFSYIKNGGKIEEVRKNITLNPNITLKVRGNIDDTKTPLTESTIFTNHTFDLDNDIIIRDATSDYNSLIHQESSQYEEFMASVPILRNVQIEKYSHEDASVFLQNKRCLEDKNINSDSSFMFSLDFKNSQTLYEVISQDRKFDYFVGDSSLKVKEFKKHKKCNILKKSKYETEINKILNLKQQIMNELSKLYITEEEIKLRTYISELKKDRKSIRKINVNKYSQ